MKAKLRRTLFAICARKRLYPTREAAQAVAALRNGRLVPYPCPLSSSHFHVGHDFHSRVAA